MNPNTPGLNFERLGSHLARNLNAPPSGVGKNDAFTPDGSAPIEICTVCNYCALTELYVEAGGSPAESSACNCIIEKSKTYPWRDWYGVLPFDGPNSNTYVSHASRDCNLPSKCDLPENAPGAKYLGTPVGVGVIQHRIRGQFIFTGADIGLDGIGIDVGGMPIIGIGSSGPEVFGLDAGNVIDLGLGVGAFGGEAVAAGAVGVADVASGLWEIFF